MAKKKTFEQALFRLEEIVEKMKDDNTSLDDSMKLYKEGVELSVFCTESLNKVEQEVKILKQEVDGTFSMSVFSDLED